MNAKTVSAILLVALAALGFFSWNQSQTIAELRKQIDATKSQESSESEASPAIAAKQSQPSSAPSDVSVSAASPDSIANLESPAKAKPNASQRVMRDFSEMLENPQMNEIMQASQRATLEVMYKDLLDGYSLTPEERSHFMDLLMARQMFRVETSMKMMSGQGSEETQLLANEMKEYDEQVKEEIDTFLNDEKDSGTFEYYEKTMQERMTLSGFKAGLAKSKIPLDEGVDKQLVKIMADQKEAFKFRSDLANSEDYNLGPDRFSKQNIESFDQDLSELYALIAAEAAEFLSAEQLAAFDQTLSQSRQLQINQLNMAANMFSQSPEN